MVIEQRSDFTWDYPRRFQPRYLYNSTLTYAGTMQTIRMRKWVSKILRKQEILNFIAAHPKLTALLAGVGISITFSFVGRFISEDKFPELILLEPDISEDKFPEFILFETDISEGGN
jgi:hypothetical protein